MRAPRGESRSLAATAIVLLSALAACGSPSQGASGQDVALAGGSPSIPGDLRGEECARDAETDPANMAAARPVARCAADAPKPQPLAEQATLRVGVRDRTEDIAPLLLADHYGEFDKENVKVEIVEYDALGDVYGGLALGEIDVAAAELHGSFFNLANIGGKSKLALGGPIPSVPNQPETSQAGLWVRTDLVSAPGRWRDLQDEKIAVAEGIGDVAAYPINSAFKAGDLSLNDLEIQFTDAQQAAADLTEGKIAAAWLGDPYWRDVVDSDLQIELVGTAPAAESLSGMVFSERLLDPARDRQIGLAFSRAIIRTINTHLADDYHADDDVVAALAEATELDPEQITETPRVVFDWEVRSGTMTRVQEVLIDLGGVNYETEVDEDELVDRSLYGDAVSP